MAKIWEDCGKDGGARKYSDKSMVFCVCSMLIMYEYNRVFSNSKDLMKAWQMEAKFKSQLLFILSIYIWKAYAWIGQMQETVYSFIWRCIQSEVFSFRFKTTWENQPPSLDHEGIVDFLPRIKVTNEAISWVCTVQ